MHYFSSNVVTQDPPLPQRLVVDILVLDRILMAIGANAPSMEARFSFVVLRIPGHNLRILSPLRTKDLDDFALSPAVFRRPGPL